MQVLGTRKSAGNLCNKCSKQVWLTRLNWASPLFTWHWACKRAFASNFYLPFSIPEWSVGDSPCIAQPLLHIFSIFTSLAGLLILFNPLARSIDSPQQGVTDLWTRGRVMGGRLRIRIYPNPRWKVRDLSSSKVWCKITVQDLNQEAPILAQPPRSRSNFGI